MDININYSILNLFAVAPSPLAKLLETGITTIVFAPPKPPADVAVFTARVPGLEPDETMLRAPLWLAVANELVVSTMSVVAPVEAPLSVGVLVIRDVAPPRALFSGAWISVGVDFWMMDLLLVGIGLSWSASEKLMATALLRSTNWKWQTTTIKTRVILNAWLYHPIQPFRLL